MALSRIARLSDGWSRRRLLTVSLTGLGAMAVAACSSSGSSGSNPGPTSAPTTAPAKPTVALTVRAATNASTTQNAQLKWVNPSGDPTDIQLWNGRANAQSVTEKIISKVTPLMGTKNG